MIISRTKICSRMRINLRSLDFRPWRIVWVDSSIYYWAYLYDVDRLWLFLLHPRHLTFLMIELWKFLSSISRLWILISVNVKLSIYIWSLILSWNFSWCWSHRYVLYLIIIWQYRKTISIENNLLELSSKYKILRVNVNLFENISENYDLYSRGCFLGSPFSFLMTCFFL